MRRRAFEVALFDVTEPEIRLVARTLDPEIVDVVRDALQAERRSEVARLDPEAEHPRLRAVPQPEEPEGGP